MAARINLKNIDYYKFKKLVIDGCRDDYNACSKEVKALCDGVQTLRFRDEEFDEESERGRFAEVCGYYKQILQGKRIDPLDVRIKSGWWGDHKNAYSAGKIKPAILKEILISKAKEWASRHGGSAETVDQIAKKIDGPGLYVFKHKDHQCFQYVGRADKVFTRCGEKLKAAFDGNLHEPLAALLIFSMNTDWDFYFTPVGENDDERVLRILENDMILRHDCIWPRGLNFRLHVDTLLEVSEFRKSCIRHHWPPAHDPVSDHIDLVNLRKQVEASGAAESLEAAVAETAITIIKKAEKTGKKAKEIDSAKPEWVGVAEPEKEEESETPDRSVSIMSTSTSSSEDKESTKVVTHTPGGRPSTPRKTARKSSTPTPTSAPGTPTRAASARAKKAATEKKSMTSPLPKRSTKVSSSTEVSAKQRPKSAEVAPKTPSPEEPPQAQENKENKPDKPRNIIPKNPKIPRTPPRAVSPIRAESPCKKLEIELPSVKNEDDTKSDTSDNSKPGTYTIDNDIAPLGDVVEADEIQVEENEDEEEESEEQPSTPKKSGIRPTSAAKSRLPLGGT